MSLFQRTAQNLVVIQHFLMLIERKEYYALRIQLCVKPAKAKSRITELSSLG
jgi:hypothetical protein